MNLDELMLDAEFKTAIEQAASSQEIAELLRSKGFEVDSADVEEAFGTESLEMDEHELETVTGGGLISSIWNYIKAIRYKAGGGGFSTRGGGNGSFGGGIIKMYPVK